MSDVHTKEQRSRNMAAIRSKDTKPEMIVRRIAHSLGFRYRLHRKNLPGKPDLVFPRRRKVIFVHGCFWHMHNCRYGRVTPKTNSSFWQNKRTSNVARDKQNRKDLKLKGWQVLTIWECQTRDQHLLENKIRDFINS